MLIELHIIYINMHYVHIHALYLFCSPISINQNCSTFIWTVIQRNQWICWSLILTLCLVNLKYQSNEQTPNALTDWNQSHFPKLAASLYFWIPPPTPTAMLYLLCLCFINSQITFYLCLNFKDQPERFSSNAGRHQPQNASWKIMI